MPSAQIQRIKLVILILLLGLLALEPALANKFETISGGVNGSFRIKTEWLQGFLVVAGGISLSLSVLAIVVPHKNALFLNFSSWKQSSAVLFVISLFCFGGAALI